MTLIVPHNHSIFMQRLQVSIPSHVGPSLQQLPWHLLLLSQSNRARCWAHELLLGVKTGSSRSGTDERGKCDNVRLPAACPSNEATIHSVVVAVAWAKADRVREWLQALSCVRQHKSSRVRVEPEGFGIGNEDEKGQRGRRTEIREVS